MKQLLFILASVVLSGSAQATSIQWLAKEHFSKVQVNGADSEYSAVLALNYFDKEITLEIFNDPCGQLTPAAPGVFKCLAAAMRIASYSVPMTIQEDGCGSVITSGAIDKTPVDGLKIDIRFTDNRARKCDDFIVGLKVVEAEVTNPWHSTQPTQYFMHKNN